MDKEYLILRCDVDAGKARRAWMKIHLQDTHTRHDLLVLQDLQKIEQEARDFKRSLEKRSLL